MVSQLNRHIRKVHRTTTKEQEKTELMAECLFSSEEEDLDNVDSCLFGESTNTHSLIKYTIKLFYYW